MSELTRILERVSRGEAEATEELWRLAYDETPNSYEALRERSNKQVDVSFSLGMWVNTDGTIADVVSGGPAYAAGLTPGMKIRAIDGRTFSPEVLPQQIAAAKGRPNPIEVAVEQATFAGTFHVDYHDGERHPHLQRVAGTPDMLSDVIRPHRR